MPCSVGVLRKAPSHRACRRPATFRCFPTLGSVPTSRLRFAAITTAIIILSYIVAMTVSSLEAVLAYVGSTGSTSISFILPGLFYYKISAPDSPHHQRLMKEDDDNGGLIESDDEGVDGVAAPDPTDGDGLLGGGVVRRAKKLDWRKGLLRRLSLALAIYSVVVMITCLVTNTLFVVSPH